MSAAINQFRDALVRLSPYPLSLAQVDACARHFELLLKWNKRLNLTRIIDPLEAAKLHYAESLFAAQFIKPGDRVIDVGSGAGFPGIPLAIVSSQAEFTLLESHGKKAVFLRESIRAVGLTNTTTALARFEEYQITENILTSRAIEGFESLLPAFFGIAPVQRLLLFLGNQNTACATDIAGAAWQCEAVTLPSGSDRSLLIATRLSST